MPDEIKQADNLVELEPEEAVDVDIASKDEATVQPVEVDSPLDDEIPEEPSEEELASYSAGVRKRIDKLTAKYREAERRETAALEYAKGVKNQNDALQENSRQVNQRYGEEYAGRITTDLESAKQKYVAAYESGDPDALVAATTELSKLTVENAALNNEVPAFRPQQPVLQQTPATAPPPDPKSQAWASQNGWFGEDEPMTYTAFAIHKNLIEKGFDPNSDAYYLEIDRRIREEFPHKFTESSEGSPTAKSGSRSPVQRVASANRAAKSTGRDTVRLTPSQVAIAKKLGVPLEEYARQVKEIAANV
tara:strand:- start:2129 stop:3046 length:918 start_codon:yes stop_codon:yes gene_type:complete